MKMITNVVTVLISLIIIFSKAYSAGGDDFCLMPNEQPPSGSGQYKGKYLPEVDEVKALVIYVQFSDDNYIDNTPWPLNSFPGYPYGNDYISPSQDQSGASYRNYGISDYYYKMSGGNYHVIGDVYPNLVFTPHTTTWYENNGYDYGYINKEVLESIDSNVDFSLYDNWKVNGTGDFSPEPDNIVDMIFIIYRRIDSNIIINNNFNFGLNTANIAELGDGNTSDLSTNDNNVIIDLSGFPGSGVTIQEAYSHTQEDAITVGAHEYAHYLLVKHFGALGGNGLMHGGTITNDVGWKAGMGMHSFEREKLGYITYTDITETNVSSNPYTLSDYLTTGDAIRILIPDLNEPQYFILENRQKFSIYDRTFNSGLIISHIKWSNIDIECADGRWDWNLCEGAGTPETSDDKIFKESLNPLGYDGLNSIYINGNKYAAKSSQLCSGLAEELQGDAGDAFNIGYNTLFAPWTSPNTIAYSDSDPIDPDPDQITLQQSETVFTDILIELIEDNGYDFEIDITFDAPPAAPKNLQISGSKGDNPHLTWDANSEGDLNHYKVYRENADPDNFIVSRDIEYFDDEDVEIGPGTTICYHVVAVDDLGNVSENSTPSQCIDGSVGKSTASELINVPEEFELINNHPNPFNPITTIQYGLPVPSHVELKIYDFLGREVKTLVDENKEAGFRSVIWNGTDQYGKPVASGMYIYTINAISIKGNKQFTQSRKMVFLK